MANLDYKTIIAKILVERAKSNIKAISQDNEQLEIDNLYFHIISMFSKSILGSAESKKSYMVDLTQNRFSRNTIYLHSQSIAFPDYISTYVDVINFYDIMHKVADIFNSMPNYRAVCKTVNTKNAYLCVFMEKL